MNRFVIFLTIVLLVWTAMHGYVFWRLRNTPWISQHISLRVFLVVASLFWLSYPLARFLEGRLWDWLVLPIEYAAANWVGFLFLLLCALLLADIITVGGFVFRAVAPRVREAAVIVAIVLGILALVQGHRRPEVTEYEVTLRGLPKERDRTVMVAISDLHLGTMIGRRWLERTIEQVNALSPHLVVAIGDIVDGDANRVIHLPGVMRKLTAPMGVFAVTGNHDYYAGVDACVRFFEDSGMRVLRDEAEQVVPGLVLAGVDDLTVREQLGQSGAFVEKALSARPEGATILLSHSPWQAEAAAAAGVDLMISGHTHNGQISPFTYMVRTRYPLVSGIYDVGNMKALVGRGTGTWGPRMRLWQRAEILRITLRSPASL